MKKLIMISAILGIVGCASTATIEQDSAYSNPNISKAVSAYVSLPQDVAYGGRSFTGSGGSVSAIISASLSRYLVSVEEADSVENFHDAMQQARISGADYLFYPSIILWQDRATEWEGKPDIVEIKITVVDVSSYKVVSAATIKDESSLTVTGTSHPQDLLPKPVGSYIESIFR